MNADEARKLIESGRVDERTLKDILSFYGISVPKGVTVKNIPDSLDLHYPVVLKVSDPEILHKTEAGGVKTGIGDYSQLRIEFEKMFMKFPGKNFLIEEMISSGVEIIIGAIDDESFGQVIMLGMGGIYTELYKDVVFRLLPIDRNDAEDMINSVGVRKFVEGFRNIRVSGDELIRLLLKISDFVTAIGSNVKQLDLNPVILGNDSAVVLDAKLIQNPPNKL